MHPRFFFTVVDCTRQLESGEKSHSNCFAVGPLLDDGASRTYYISCSKLNVQDSREGGGGGGGGGGGHGGYPNCTFC